jgi:hypothetical protein
MVTVGSDPVKPPPEWALKNRYPPGYAPPKPSLAVRRGALIGGTAALVGLLAVTIFGWFGLLVLPVIAVISRLLGRHFRSKLEP